MSLVPHRYVFPAVLFGGGSLQLGPRMMELWVICEPWYTCTVFHVVLTLVP